MSSKEKFQKIFHAKLSELIAANVPKTEAAAQALTFAQFETRRLTGATNNAEDNAPACLAALPTPQITEECRSQTLKKAFDLDRLFNLLSSFTTSCDSSEVQQLIEQLFSDPTSLQETFHVAFEFHVKLKETDSYMEVCESDDHSISNIARRNALATAINIDKINEVYRQIFAIGDTRLGDTLFHSLCRMVKVYSNAFTSKADSERFDPSSPIKELLKKLENQVDNNSRSPSHISFIDDGCKLLTPIAVVFAYPDLQNPQCDAILKQILFAMDKLNLDLKNLFINWMIDGAVESQSYMHYLGSIRQFITLQLYQDAIDLAKLGARALGWLYAILSHYPTVSYAEFYNDALNDDYIKTREGQISEYEFWIRDRNRLKYRISSDRNTSSSSSNNKTKLSKTSNDSNSDAVLADNAMTPMDVEDSSDSASEPIIVPYLTKSNPSANQCESFISCPFLLSPATKAAVLELESAIQMRREMDHEIQMAIFARQRYAVPYFILRVNRETIVQDTIVQIDMHSDRPSEFKKPLKVIFDDAGEEGVDAGGLRKEFYQIMTRKVMDPAYGMFQYYESTRLVWFNADFMDIDYSGYKMIGLLLGVAIYNSITIDLRFPQVLYKKLKGDYAVQLTDLSELQPDLSLGLEKLLSFDGNVEETFQLNFQIIRESQFGERIVVDLLPNGEHIAVTNANRQQYIDLYVEHLLTTCIKPQFDAFKKGFQMICGGAALDLFAYQELELLICGNPTLDFNALQQGTKYDDGYTIDSAAVKMFWNVIHGLDEEEKKMFLRFVSGSDRSPIDGLAHLGFVISKNGADDNRLPSAHTCFNHLLLPEYSSESIMAEKLRYAISHAEGFGLR